MGAIAGVFGISDNPGRAIEEMLLAMKHRGAKWNTATVNERQGWGIGYSSNDGLEKHFHESSLGAVALDGSLFQRSNFVRFAQTKLMKRPAHSAVFNLMNEPGEFAILGSYQNRMIALRDLNGLKPLYFAGNSRHMAFASERKALWKIGLKNVKSVPPGYLYSISKSGATRREIVDIQRPPRQALSFDQAALQLVRVLKKSIRRVTNGIGKVAVGFSGGLDSALAALLAKEICEVELVSVGLSGSSELSAVDKYARELDLHLTTVSFERDSLESYVRRIVWLIEEPNLMKVSVAIPLHWAAMAAARQGCKVMLCGQGSDELYGGYQKYARTLDTKGRKALDNELYQSVIHASQVNYERDEQATAPSGVELRTPFADLDVIRFSLTIPSEYKVKSGNDTTRKWVLRSAGQRSGLPDDMAWKRKKAIQHGTGVENAIRKLAKKRTLSAESYLVRVHEEVRELDSMP